MKPSLRRAATWGSALALAGVALVGAMHTKSGRALLGLGGCPFEKQASAEQVEAYRTKSLASLRTATGKAPSRPALGFLLGSSAKPEVSAWASANGLACTEELKGAALRCVGRLARGDGAVAADAYFRFAPEGTLVAADLVHVGTTPAAGLASARRIASELGAKVSASPRVVGEDSATALSAGRSSRVGFELRFDDYAVDVSATNLASPETDKDQEIVVREQYRLLSELPVR